jgi:hypothetical protein
MKWTKTVDTSNLEEEQLETLETQILQYNVLRQEIRVYFSFHFLRYFLIPKKKKKKKNYFYVLGTEKTIG